MSMPKYLVVLVCCLLAAGCARSDEELANQRAALEDVIAKAPLPEGGSLDKAHAQFNKGCQAFIECADRSDQATTYVVPVELSDTHADAAGLCAYVAKEIKKDGFQLVAIWQGSTASFGTSPDLPDHYAGPRSRWLDVDDTVCATGHVTSAVVVKPDGSSPNDSAYLVWSLDTVKPSYTAVRAQVRDLPTGSAALTDSEMVYLRGVLDHELVIAADPATDGIRVDGRAGTQWSVPSDVRALRFTIKCTNGDAIDVTMMDRTPANSAKKAENRSHECSGSAAEMEFPDPADSVSLDISVHDKPVHPSSAPRTGHGPFTVELFPVL